jgi:hypothetical protein
VPAGGGVCEVATRILDNALLSSAEVEEKDPQGMAVLLQIQYRAGTLDMTLPSRGSGRPYELFVTQSREVRYRPIRASCGAKSKLDLRSAQVSSGQLGLA